MRVLVAIVLIGVAGLFVFRSSILDAADGLRADYRPAPSSGELPGRYDKVVEATYMARCQRDTGDVAYCRCTLDKLSTKFSQRKFEKLNVRIAKHPKAKIPARADKVFKACKSESASS